MNYEYWRRQNVYFASNELEISDFLDKYYSGFDLDKLLRDLEQVAVARGFEWDTIQVEITPKGSLYIQHLHDTLNSDEEPLTLKRILKIPTEDGRRVSHEEMILPESMQRQELSRALMRPYYYQYRQASVDHIDTYAGDKGGGYAWARYGFDAARQADVMGILQRAHSLDIEPEAIDILEEDVIQFYESHPPDTPFRIWAWSQTPFAEKLLVGTYWKAVLDLHDLEQVSIFEAYLGLRP
jgi:hypothetical protein